MAALALCLCGTAALHAQEPAAQPPAGATAPAAAAANPNEPKLVFEREVFSYPGANRRDPFHALTSSNSGPLFEDMELHMIIHTGDPRTSMAAISDATKKMYRLRRGDSVGNATVVDIQPARVVLSVVDFGVARTETLVMKGKEPR